MMKHLISIFLICLAASNAYCQKVDLTGTWKTVSVDTGLIYLNAKTDSVSLSDTFKKQNRTAVSLQNEVASVRMMYSHTHFIFGEDDAFLQYMTEKETVAPLFKGYYILKGNTIMIDVMNRANIPLTKEMTFKMKDGLMYLTVDADPVRSAKGTVFVLEKVKGQ